MQLLRRLAVFDVQVALQRRHHDVGPSLEQVDRLDETLHYIHDQFAVGRDQLSRAGED
jgi:hypothetical protein